MERGRTELTNNYDEERLNNISRMLEWRSSGVLLSPSDYSFLRERINYWKRLFYATIEDRDQLRADRIRMMLERNDARWIARKLWAWATAELDDNMDRAWDDLPEWMQKAILGDG